MVSSNPNLATGGTSAACYHSGVLNTNVLYIAGPGPLQGSALQGCRLLSAVHRHACSSGTASRLTRPSFSDTTSSQELHSHSLGAAAERNGSFTYCFFLFRLLTTHSCSTSCVGKLCLITSKYLLN